MIELFTALAVGAFWSAIASMIGMRGGWLATMFILTFLAAFFGLLFNKSAGER